MAFTLKKVISETECIPFGYGIAYFDPAARRAICYPLLINSVVVLFRNIVWLIVRSDRYDYKSKVGADHTAKAFEETSHSNYNTSRRKRKV